MTDEKRRDVDTRPERRPNETDDRREERARKPYRKPALKSGDRMEKTTLASCLTGPQFCGPYALEA